MKHYEEIMLRIWNMSPGMCMTLSVDDMKALARTDIPSNFTPVRQEDIHSTIKKIQENWEVEVMFNPCVGNYTVSKPSFEPYYVLESSRDGVYRRGVNPRAYAPSR
jgi:hypothetical protein